MLADHILIIGEERRGEDNWIEGSSILPGLVSVIVLQVWLLLLQWQQQISNTSAHTNTTCYCTEKQFRWQTVLCTVKACSYCVLYVCMCVTVCLHSPLTTH